LSPAFIALPDYGTRSSTFVCRAATELRLVEREFDEAGTLRAETRHTIAS